MAIRLTPVVHQLLPHVLDLTNAGHGPTAVSRELAKMNLAASPSRVSSILRNLPRIINAMERQAQEKQAA